MSMMSPLESRLLSLHKTPWELKEIVPGKSAILCAKGALVFTGTTTDMKYLCDYANKLMADAKRMCSNF